MACCDARWQQIEAFDELSEREQDDLVRHLAECPSCLAAFDFRESLFGAVKKYMANQLLLPTRAGYLRRWWEALRIILDEKIDQFEALPDVWAMAGAARSGSHHALFLNGELRRDTVPDEDDSEIDSEFPDDGPNPQIQLILDFTGHAMDWLPLVAIDDVPESDDQLWSISDLPALWADQRLYLVSVQIKGSAGERATAHLQRLLAEWRMVPDGDPPQELAAALQAPAVSTATAEPLTKTATVQFRLSPNHQDCFTDPTRPLLLIICPSNAEFTGTGSTELADD